MYSGEKRRPKKYSIFIVSRAIFVRVLFAIHGLIAIWLLHSVTGDQRYWYICLALAGLMGETVITLYKKRGNEWKWFCPSVFFYLLCIVPAIWFLELYELEKRLRMEKYVNDTGQVEKSIQRNETFDDLIASAESIDGLGLDFPIPISALTSDQWLRTLEQLLLLFLILGRWLLPKGKLTHDQLSQLLLVYIGTAADIVEFFEAFKERQVRHNRILCMTILAIWSWSLLQFTMVLTAAKARKDQSGLISKRFNSREPRGCCTPDVYGIIISIFMQDAPFLVLRLLLIFKFNVVSYTNMFFTCKNTLVIMLLLYRLIVIQCENRSREQNDSCSDYMMSESSSRTRLMVHSTSTDQYYNYKTKVNLREPSEDPDEPRVDYVVRRHLSNGDLREEASPALQPVLRRAYRTGGDSTNEDEDEDEDFKLSLDLGNIDSLKRGKFDLCDMDESIDRPTRLGEHNAENIRGIKGEMAEDINDISL